MIKHPNYVVTDADGHVTWDGDLELPEAFPTRAAAQKRAEAVAKADPGRPARIYELCAEVIADVLPPRTRAPGDAT